MTYSEQLEREAGQTRAQVENTLEELRARMTPGQVVDQLVDYARDGGGGMFFRNLGRRTVENPLPLAVIGAGMAWLMLSNGRSHARNGGPAVRDDAEPFGDRTYPETADTVDSLGDRAAAAAEGVADSARTAADALADKARSAASTVGDMTQRARSRMGAGAESVGQTASSAYVGASSGVRRAASTIGSSASHIGHDAVHTTRSVVAFCKEQPLVLAGLGLAIGAAIGAVFPATETEERLMGSSENEAKRRLANMGGAQTQVSTPATDDSGDHGQPTAPM